MPHSPVSTQPLKMSNANNTNQCKQPESLQDGMGDGRDADLRMSLTPDLRAGHAQMGVTEGSEVGGIVREHVGHGPAGAEEDANNGNEFNEVDDPQTLAEALRVKDGIVKDPRTAAEKE
ncbi:hypothetical protein K439DRAFT_1612135 [Ramaria rubella]|nr:hypothetical protein K439DRAFT_1612135 [Ramaria rubella]